MTCCRVDSRLKTISATELFMKQTTIARHIILASIMFSWLAPTGQAFDPTSSTIKVEEDWVAYVRNPDASVCAPQILNLLSPTGTTVGPYGLFELNHGSLPNFESGGYQIQTWINETENSTKRSCEQRRLQTDYDKINYTVAMEIDGDRLRFRIHSGQSKTWGSFGSSSLSASVPRDSLDLTGYTPQASVDNTTINVGAHRVQLLLQTETRYYTASGIQHTDTQDRVIHWFHELVQYVSLEDYERYEEDYTIDITE